MNNKVYVADLTHTSNGIMALTFPLGAAFVTSYAKQVLGDHLDFKLFKFPEQLSQAISDEPPLVLGLTNYSWNVELAYKLSSWAKRHYPDLIVVFGGPNFPNLPQEKVEFLRSRAAVDFCFENEGEIGFAELLSRLQEYDFDAEALKRARETITNCSYLSGDHLVQGGIQRIRDINIIPSPYLSGAMDEFFDLPLAPMIETTRGCPFSCTFCADGLPSKNKVERFDGQRIKDELNYICEHVRNVEELTITDLNFGMYKQDVETAQYIADIQSKYGWPTLVRASTGKNRPERIMAAATLLKGSLGLSSAIQSTDKEVLKNIQRSNISVDAYQQLQDFSINLDKDAKTVSEIILALPGDTKEKHFESLRYGIDNRVNSLRMFQAIMLIGTEMASPKTREAYELVTKFRIIPGGVGMYQFGDERIPVAEIEEIIVGSKDMTFEDYVSCRVMNLMVEAFHNNALFEEVFSALRVMGVSPFDFLVYLNEHEELYTPKVKVILASFIEASAEDLYDSHNEAESSSLSKERIERYLSGELGSNELLEHKNLLYRELEDTVGILVRTVKLYLEEKGLLNEAAGEYFDQLGEFILCAKNEIENTDLEIVRPFSYDFKAIEEMNFEVAPTNIQKSDEEILLKFFHTPTQKKQIRNAVDLHVKHSGGSMRMIYQSNLKSLYRVFELV